MKKIFCLLTILLIFPLNVLAYSDYVYLGGENVGIDIKSKGVIVSGFYNVNGFDIKDYGINIGDRILSVNGNIINSAYELLNNIKLNNGKVNLQVDSFNKTKNINVDIPKIDGVYKTGLYIKDNIIGVGTLTYVDPNSKVFGALGHEIIDSRTGQIFKINYGNLYDSVVTNIIPSDYGYPGEKNASIDKEKAIGRIKENTNKGIFGNFNIDLNDKELIKVANENEIKLGKAYFYTVLDNKEIKKYEINIIKLFNDRDTKNMLYEIVDKELLAKTNGIIQGMSGSPIVQNDKIIGAVTHVVIDNPHKGYGIFITNMLKEGEN